MRIVASLTTIPSRLYTIYPVIKSLLDQDRGFDRIYINLPHTSKKGIWYDVDKFVSELKLRKLYRDNLYINRVPSDLGPITKLLPTLSLENDPETRIVTFDDDQIVTNGIVSLIEKYSTAYPDKALSLSGHIVGDMPFLFQKVESPKTICSVDWIQGVNMIVYRRKWFEFLNLTDYTQLQDISIQNLMRKHDDHWISFILAKNGIDRAVIPAKLADYFQQTENARENCISQTNTFISEVCAIALYLHQIGLYNKSVEVPYKTYGSFVLGFILFVIFVVLVLIYLGVSAKYIAILLLVIYTSLIATISNFVTISHQIYPYLLVPYIVLVIVLFRVH